jgi:tetratricopeptide (TPR) repeat protein
MSIRTGVVLLLLLSGQTIAPADADGTGGRYDRIVQEGIQQVYNLQFEKAEDEFRQLVAMRPHDPAGPFFLAMVDWWRIVIDIDNTRYDDRFYTQLDRVIQMCDSILDQNPNDVNALFFKGGAIGFKGRLEFHRNDYFAAANAGRQALPIVQEASQLDSSNYDILLGTGMYNYFADVIPQEYPFVKPLLLFIPAGDRQKGLRELQLAAEKGKYASVETWYFLLQIYFYYEKDYQRALSIAQNLFSRFPDNVLFHRYLGRCETMIGNWTEAGKTFGEIARRAREGQRGYSANAEREAEYYVGMSMMVARQYDSALQHFYRCDQLSRQLDQQEPSGFMVMANLKVGNIYDIQGKRDLALSEYHKVLAMKEYKDSHSQAESYLKNPARF